MHDFSSAFDQLTSPANNYAPLRSTPRSRAPTFLDNHPEGIVLTDSIRMQIRLAIKETTVPIIIEGETGTGKEQIVKHIHSHMNKQAVVPLVVLNCANLSKELAASTLFGHRKGAFTGAIENSTGAIGKAHNGMLFLDEFHRLDSAIQEQILRTMQDGTYQRIGDPSELQSNFRLVISTPKSLEQHAIDGQILMDLRFRIYGIEIKIPPLRERLHQMGDFIDCFITNSNRAITLSPLERERLIHRCSDFYWQGNVRQLFGVLQMLVLQASAYDKPILAEDLQVYPSMMPPAARKKDNVVELAGAKKPKESDSELTDLIQGYLRLPTSYEDFIDKFEKALLTKLSGQYSNVKSMCESLHLPRSTLFAKKRRLSLS